MNSEKFVAGTWSQRTLDSMSERVKGELQGNIWLQKVSS